MEIVLKQAVPVRPIPMDLASLQEELDEFYNEMQQFAGMDPGTVMVKLAAFTARASWIRSLIQRQVENRAWTKFRTTQIEPFIDECERQFRVWSRTFSVQTQEWEMSKG